MLNDIIRHPNPCDRPIPPRNSRSNDFRLFFLRKMTAISGWFHEEIFGHLVRSPSPRRGGQGRRGTGLFARHPRDPARRLLHWRDSRT
jgi:hypothetical protein